MRQEEVLLVAIGIGTNQLKVASTRLGHPPEEVERIAPPCIVVLGRQVLKLAHRHSVLVMYRGAEGAGLLGEEVGVVLDGLDQLRAGKEVLGQFLHQLGVHPVVEHLEARAQHVRTHGPDVVRPVEAEDILGATDNKVSALAEARGIQVGFFGALLLELVEVRVVGDEAHVRLGAAYVGQVVLVVPLLELVLQIPFLLGHAYKHSQVDFLAGALEEALAEGERPQVDIAQHVANPAPERLTDVDAQCLLQVDVDYHPVGFAPSLQVVAVEAGHAQELEDLVLVNVHGHVAHDEFLELVQLQGQN